MLPEILSKFSVVRLAGSQLFQRPFTIPALLQDKAEDLIWQQTISKISDPEDRRKQWERHVSDVRRQPLFNDYVYQVEGTANNLGGGWYKGGAIKSVNLRDAARIREDLRDYMRVDRKFMVPTGNLKIPLPLPSRGLARYIRLMRVPCVGQMNTACSGCPGLS